MFNGKGADVRGLDLPLAQAQELTTKINQANDAYRLWDEATDQYARSTETADAAHQRALIHRERYELLKEEVVAALFPERQE